MEENSEKVNSIVDKIVESNNSFKLKSSLEQDKEKDSMAKSINTALSALNEVGKDLVLQDLSVDPDEKFKGFIDSVGNIDISGLTKFTATIVKAKIEEAEKEGLNLRSGQEVFTNNKNLLAESILSLAVVDTMIKNYDNLSYSERKNLWDNFLNLSKEQQKAIVNADRKKLGEIISSSQTTDEQKKEASKIEAMYKKADEIEQLLNSDNPEDKLKGIAELKKDNEARSKFVEYMRKNNPNFSIDDIDYNNSDTQQAFLGLARQSAGEKSLELQEKVAKREEFTYEFIDEYTDRNEVKSENDSSLKLKEQASSNIQGFGETISQEIQQLPVALGKSNFSQEEIQKALRIYRNYIADFSTYDDDTINQIKSLNKTEIADNFLDDFTNLKESGEINTQTFEILKIMSGLTFDESLQEILTSSEIRKQFLEQFDKVIEKEIDTKQPLQLNGELAEVFSKYFKDNAVDIDISAIETKKEEQAQQSIPEEQPKKMEQTAPPISESPTTPEEHTQESVAIPEQEPIEEVPQNMAMVKQDNSFIGKIKRAMSKIKSNIKTKVSNFFGKKENITEEDKTTSSEQGKTTSPKLYNTLDRYTIENNHIEKKALEHFKDDGIVPKENESDKELGD